MKTDTKPKRYLSGPEVDDRYGIDRTTRLRWQKNATLNFPKPAIMNGRPYFAEDELEAFERSRVAGRAA